MTPTPVVLDMAEIERALHGEPGMDHAYELIRWADTYGAALVYVAKAQRAALVALMADPWIAESIASAAAKDMLGGDALPEYVADCERLTKVAVHAVAAVALTADGYPKTRPEGGRGT